MQYNKPKNDQKYEWTNHVSDKMTYYRISPSLVKRIIRFPSRKEEGIAPGTLAAMKSAGSQKTPQEIWVMYQDLGQRSSLKGQNLEMLIQPKKKIISAWRYPGVSPLGKKIPIPDDILQELDNLID